MLTNPIKIVSIIFPVTYMQYIHLAILLMGTDIHELSGKAEKGSGFRDTFKSFSHSLDSLYYACRSLVRHL